MTHPCTIFAFVTIGDNNMKEVTKEKKSRRLDMLPAVER